MVGKKTDKSGPHKVVGKKTSTPTPITVVDVAMGTRPPETVLLLTATCNKCRVTAWPHKTVNLQTKKSTPASDATTTLYFVRSTHFSSSDFTH